MNRSKQLLYSPYKRVVISKCHTTCVKRPPHLKWPTTTIKTVWLITYIVQAHLVRSRWLALAQNEEKQRNMNTAIKATVIEVAKSVNKII